MATTTIKLTTGTSLSSGGNSGYRLAAGTTAYTPTGTYSYSSPSYPIKITSVSVPWFGYSAASSNITVSGTVTVKIGSATFTGTLGSTTLKTSENVTSTISCTGSAVLAVNTSYNISVTCSGSNLLKAGTRFGTNGVNLTGTYAANTYTITYLPGSYSSGSNYTQTKTAGTTLTLRAATYSRTGYTQSGWSTASAGTSKAYNLSASYTANAAATFYPYWTINSYKLTVSAGTGGTATGGGTYNYGASYTIKATANAGYTFSKWTYSGGWTGSNTNATVTGTMPATSGTATASFTANTYTVTLNGNGGSGGTTSVTATYASAMPSVTIPTRAGYAFIGYYDTSASSGGTQYYTNTGASARTWNKTSNTTLYARWGNPTSYNLTLNANGGKFLVTPVDEYSDTKNIISNWNKFRLSENSFLALFKDSYFANGNNNISNYAFNRSGTSANATSTITRVSKSGDNPFSSTTYEINAALSKGSYNISDCRAGWVLTINSVASLTYLHLFVAKVPAGYNLELASNATGDGASVEWLTSLEGTGNFEVYAYKRICGNSGTFSTTGFVYIASNNTFSVNIRIAYSEVFNITSSLVISVPYDTLISDLPIPVKSGYKVKTWYTNYTGNGKKDYGRARMFTNKISIHLNAYMNNWLEYATGNDANNHYLMRAISCTEGGGWNIESADGYIRFLVWDAGAGSYVGPTANVKFEDLEPGWHTFDMTFDGTNWRGYVDGELIATSLNFVGNIGYNTTNGIFVAAEAEGDQTTARYYRFVGWIGNVIILNDDDLIPINESRMMIMPGANTTITAYWERANHINVRYNNEWHDVPIYVYYNSEWLPAMIKTKINDDWEQP